MIFSSIKVSQDINNYPPAIQTAINYLKETDFNNLNPGVYEINKDMIYAQVIEMYTGSITDKKPEFHKNYVDIQYLVSGQEHIGITTDLGNYTVSESFIDRDLYYYDTIENEFFITATPGCYSIFYPSDIHRPGVSLGSNQKIKKVVIKVRVSLLTNDSDL